MEDIRTLTTAEDLDREAARFAATLAPLPGAATLVTLSGELGAGKTTFTQGVAKALGVQEHVTSPTFVLEKLYSLPETAAFKRLVHIDAYRLMDARELAALQLDEVMGDSGTLVLLEWPERVEGGLPLAAHEITLTVQEDGTRMISYAKASAKKKEGTGKKVRLVLLDAHAIIHRAYHALPEFTGPDGAPTGALYGLSSMLLRLCTDLKPDYIAGCYDLPKPTVRHEAHEDYKASRGKIDDALIAQLTTSRKVFEAFSIPIYEREGFEADDILGTIVELFKDDANVEIVIASGDMDTMQLIEGKKVQVYTLKKGLNDIILYDEQAIIDRYGFAPELIADWKGLRGDPSDNIKGVPGIGEKTATELVPALRYP